MAKYRVTYVTGEQSKDNGWSDTLKSVTVEAETVTFGNWEYSKIVNDDGTLTVYFHTNNETVAVYTNVRVLKLLA